MSIFDRVLAQRIKQAKAAEQDSRESAIALLVQFVEAQMVSECPTLVSYVKDCIKTWLDEDCDPSKAAKSFNVDRPAHRTKDQQIFDKHVRAMRCYCLLRGRGRKVADAIAVAARSVHLSESSLKRLLEAPYDEFSPDESSPLSQALGAIKSDAVRRRCLPTPRKPPQ